MPREAIVDSRQEILRTAARLFQQRGYDATSMNDVAAALKLSKGGLYHHFQSKDEILFEIMNHAMEITEERVLAPVRGIADPQERLRALIRLHIEVVLSPRDREITVMLHENHPLPPALRKRINSRKKEYIHFVEGLIADVQKDVQKEAQKEAQKEGQRTGPARSTVSPRAAAFALLGMINWIYQWYKPEGDLQTHNLVPQFTELVFGGIRVKALFAEVGEIDQQRAQSGKLYREFLRVPAMSAGLYVLSAGATDPQQPHHEAEMYYVVRGRARFRAGDEDQEVSAGSVLFVAAEVEHRFHDIVEELAVLVFFAPAES